MTPYYSEDILLSKDDINKRNSDGVSTLLYLQTIYHDDWENFIERRGLKALAEHQAEWSPANITELRMWASLRGQTLFRTVEGMMYNEAAVVLMSQLESLQHEQIVVLAKTKFNYVVACQIYGQMKKNNEPKADDIGIIDLLFFCKLSDPVMCFCLLLLVYLSYLSWSY
jgi:callose synthase